MKVKEIKRLLSYFSDDIDVVVEDENGKLNEIFTLKGTVNDNIGMFTVKIDTNKTLN